MTAYNFLSIVTYAVPSYAGRLLSAGDKERTARWTFWKSFLSVDCVVMF